MIDIMELPMYVFNKIKKYVLENSNYNPKVFQNVVDKTYPLIVVENNSNRLYSQTQDIYRLDVTRALSFEISILAINVENVDSSIICNELSNLVNYVMQEELNMQGGLDACLKNINTDKATKYILHYNCILDARHNIIY